MSDFFMPEFQKRLNSFLDLCQKGGFRVGVASGYRSFEDQNKLYLKVPKVTNAKGGFSWHNYGVAADVVFRDQKGNLSWSESWPWAALGGLGKTAGLEWGGDWKSFKDRPHFQLTGNMSIRSALRYHQQGGIGLVWLKIGELLNA